MKKTLVLGGLGLALAVLGCRGAPGILGRPAPTPVTVAGTVDVPALIAERCKWCHSADRANTHHFDRQGWTKTIGEMVGKGARLTPDERAAVIDFLAARDAAVSPTTQHAH